MPNMMTETGRYVHIVSEVDFAEFQRPKALCGTTVMRSMRPRLEAKKRGCLKCHAELIRRRELEERQLEQELT